MSKTPANRETWGNNDDDFMIINENNPLKRYKKIIDIVKKYQAKKIILTQYSTLYTLVLILYSIVNKIKYYIGPIENMHKRNLLFDSLKKFYFTIVSKKSNAIFAIGNHAANDYSQLYRGPILNIPYTFDLKYLLKSKEYNTVSDKITFLYSGRLIPFRNPLLVIECFAEVVKSYSNTQLIMSGEGILRADCNVLIKQLKIEDKVIWKNDFKGWYDIHKELYRQADVLLALQHYSTWGLIIQEAMAAGLGIIATRSMEATNELIIDNYNGYLVDLNKHEIISKMLKYIQNRELITLHASRSQDIVQVINLENVGNNFLDFFEDN